MLKQLAFLIVLFAAIAAAAYIYRAPLSEALYSGPPPIIVAEVRFTNNCPIADSNFVLKDLSSGRTVHFSNGVAHIQVLEGAPLIIQLTAHFTDVQFNGFSEKAKRFMRMTADCSGSERERGTVRSLNEKFGG